ncbi:MAG: efflux RND transporter periplasmic adaptor subunit [Micropepsaceae bacterium]
MNQQSTPPLPKAEMLRRLGIDDAGPRISLRRKALFIGAAALAAGIAVLALFVSRGGGAEYTTAEVARGDLVVSVSATGTLQPENQVDVGAEISGRIENVLVDFNDSVGQGDVLAELDTEQLEARLAQSEASLDAARANVTQNEATLTQTRASAERTEGLFERNVVSAQDLESARADLLRAQANVQRARADAALAAAQVDADSTALSKTVIRSPITGVVLDRLVEPGQAVAASFQTPVLFTLASDLSRMELVIDIDEADIGSVREGQTASFSVDAFPQRRFDAEIVSVRNAPNIENGVVTYKGVLVVDNSSMLLRPGLTANAVIVVAELSDKLFVPNGALRFTPGVAEAGPIPPAPILANGVLSGRVWVLEGGRPVHRDIVVGLSNGQLTEVISGGLAAGDEVITDVRNASTP